MRSELAGAEPVALWHEQVTLDGVAAVVLPGGFAYGDYLRAGVIARFSPVMRAVEGVRARRRARARDLQRFPGPRRGRPRAGSAAAEPRPAVPRARCPYRGRAAGHAVHARPERAPASHCGCRSPTARAATTRTTRRSMRSKPMAGCCSGTWMQTGARPADDGRPRPTRTAAFARSPACINAAGNVAGLMPHPERASEAILGSDDGCRRSSGRWSRARRAWPRATVRSSWPGPDDGRGGAVRHRASRGARAAPSTAGLTDDELDAIRERLGGREPNELELAMFSVMWSEHCSYKSSKPLLRTLPTTGEGVVAGPGENAGVIAIGDGLAVAFKIESHNHPSAVEPYQGAATGVGGILRDIFTMGARPIAVLDALRFGDPSDARTRHLVEGVVRGVGGYGNCVGIPTVGGELVFDHDVPGQPARQRHGRSECSRSGTSRLAAAPGPGNLVVLFGSTTGRDGIGGASVLASATFGDDETSDRRLAGASPRSSVSSSPSRSKRPSVQVGDPFAEKLLIEASLELIDRGLVEGLQDLGAGGITCATSETADRAGTGIAVDLDAIPRREPDMAPFEVMISESQERMCAVVRPEHWDDVREIAERWGLPVAVIGRVTEDGDITVTSGGAGARSIPATALTSDAIVHERIARAPEHRRAAPAPGVPLDPSDRLPERGMDPGAVLLALLGSPNLASRRRRLRAVRLDGRGGHRRRTGPWCCRAAHQGHDQGARRVDRRQPGGRRVDPYRGAAMSVAEATRNVEHHRCPAARRDELPQLRRPDPARGVLAAQRGRARPRRRLSGARPAGDRRQRVALQRVAGRRRSPRRPRSASSGC